MKIMIFGVDGCDFRRVKEWDLQNLQQVENGYFKSIINKEIGVPVSPQVWGSFITGKVQNIGGWRKYSLGMNLFFKRLPLWMKVRIATFLSNRGLFISYRNKKDLNGRTLFDCIKNNVAINVPMWNFDVSIYIKMLKRKLRYNYPEWTQEAYEICLLRVMKKVYERIDTDWDFFMFFTPLLDSLCHMELDDETIFSAYQQIDKIIQKVNIKLNDDVLFIVISDHGFENQTHSNYSFYSFNRKIDFIPKNITDFYNYILNELTN